MTLYVWNTVTQTGGLSSTIYPVANINFSDAAVAAGTYNASETCYVYGSSLQCFNMVGDPSQVEITSLIPGNIAEVQGSLTESIDVTFNPDGTLAGAIVYNDGSSQFSLTGSELSWVGKINSDLSICGLPGGCQVTGYWVDPLPVPEPSSALVMMGALSVGAVIQALRRSRARGRSLVDRG